MDKEIKKENKENTEKVTKKTTKKKERRLEKEVLHILLFFGFLIIVFVVASAYFKSLNNFEYEGIEFSKQRIGDIPLYHHSYFFKGEGEELFQYNLYLRNDPFELDFIPVDGDLIRFEKSIRVVYLSIDSDELNECRYGQIATSGLASFLTDNQIPLKIANPDFHDAKRRNEEWATCENKPGNIVIEVIEGDETKIEIENGCYRIYVANCEILQAIEKFELQSILDARQVRL